MSTAILAILSWTASQIETQHAREMWLPKEPEKHSYSHLVFVNQLLRPMDCVKCFDSHLLTE
jgi:hypothetical protein